MNLLEAFKTCVEQVNNPEGHTFKVSDHALHIGDYNCNLNYRRFFNKFAEIVDDPRYLEIGCWTGGSSSSIMSGNKLKMTCIDNYDINIIGQLGIPNAKELFLANTAAEKTDDIDFTFIEEDFRKVDYKTIGKHNIFYFDGPHDEGDHYDGLVIPQDALDDEYLLIVDDYNWSYVKEGNLRAIQSLNLTVLDSFETGAWGNGFYFAIVRK